MAMFGKNTVSTAVTYDEDKKKGEKKKGILNMPISTNIQYSKDGGDGNMPSFDSFDPFDDFKVGERVQMTADGKLVAYKEEEKAPEVKEEAKVIGKAVPQSFTDSFEPPFSFEPDFGSPVGQTAEVQAPKLESPTPTASAPKAKVEEVKTVETKVVTQTVKPEITGEVISKLASEMSPQLTKEVSATVVDEVTKKVTAQLTKELSGSLASQVASEVTKNMPTSTGDGEVKVVTPQVSKEVLDAVVKEVTASVTKSVQEQISKEVLTQLGAIAPAINGNVDNQMKQVGSLVSTSVSSQVNDVVGKFATSVSGQVNDVAGKLASNISEQFNVSGERMTRNMQSMLSEVTSKIELSVNQGMQNMQPQIPDAFLREMKDMYEQVIQVKKMLENPEADLSPSELDKRVEEKFEQQKQAYIKNTIVPLALAIIDARENIIRMGKSYKEKGTDVPTGIFNGYAIDFRDLLEKHKIEVYQSAKGDAYNPAIHKLLSKVQANKEEQNNTIANSQSCGYKYNGEIIFPEKVEVYSFSK